MTEGMGITYPIVYKNKRRSPQHILLLYFRRGGIRTPDTIVRSHILYPTELHAVLCL